MTRPTLTALSALAALATASLPGCGVLPGQSCNLMYAPSGVLVEFDASQWTPGEWTVEVDGVVCTVLLDPAATPDEQIDCDLDGTPRLEIQLNTARDRIDQAWLIESTPDVLDVRLLLDGVVVVEESINPEYAVDEPNGRGCGERRAATVSVVVDEA